MSGALYTACATSIFVLLHAKKHIMLNLDFDTIVLYGLVFSRSIKMCAEYDIRRTVGQNISKTAQNSKNKKQLRRYINMALLKI